MSEEQSGITPTRPPDTYAPKPSETSPDRNPDGATLPPGRRRKKRKKKNEGPVQPADKDESPNSPGDGHAIDILAEAFQIETSLKCMLAECAGLIESNDRGLTLAARDDGTAIALQMKQAPGRTEAVLGPASV